MFASQNPGAGPPVGGRMLARAEEAVSAVALGLMVLLPLVEIAARPWLGRGIDNAPVLVQHLGLVLAMAGALVAERHGHLTTLARGTPGWAGPRSQALLHTLAQGGSAAVCGVLALASARFVLSEWDAARPLAYGVSVAWVQAVLPAGFALLAAKLGARCAQHGPARALHALGWPLAGVALGLAVDGQAWPQAAAWVWPWLALMLLCGAPIFAALGGLSLWLVAGEGLPLAAVTLSHYQITVNPSLPALPLFTLAGLVFARTGAAQRLGAVFMALFGRGVRGSVLAAASMCSIFTAFTGGSGVTILALGGLLLPLLREAGYPERRGVGLVTSASALGVLLAPSVPLLMVAVIARVPIQEMFLAGVLPAVLMVACLLLVGGFLRTTGASPPAAPTPPRPPLLGALRAAKWELGAPVVALGSLLSGLATPTESAAVTAAYAVLTQGLLLRELGWRALWRTLVDAAMLIGGVLLILGMALALSNYLVDVGIPDAAVDWVQARIPDRHLFLLALCLFLFLAAALMEIYAAILVLVPLLLPLARAYGIDPVHFGIIFLAAMEVGFLCPPAGLNLYFASALFKRPVAEIAVSVLPALAAIFVGTVVIALWPALSTALPAALLR